MSNPDAYRTPFADACCAPATSPYPVGRGKAVSFDIPLACDLVIVVLGALIVITGASPGGP